MAARRRGGPPERAVPGSGVVPRHRHLDLTAAITPCELARSSRRRVFTFGDANYRGSVANKPPPTPTIGIITTADPTTYTLIDTNGTPTTP